PAEQRKEANIDSKVPDNPSLPVLVRQLSAAATGAGVSLTSIAPSPPTLVTTTATTTTPTTGGTAAAPAALAQIPVSVTIIGSYANVERFFHATETLTRAMTVGGWTMSAQGGGSGSTTSTPNSSGTATSKAAAPNAITATLSAVVYMSPPVT